eukprot:gene15202-17988_t
MLAQSSETLEVVVMRIASELGTELIAVPWLPYFYKLAKNVGISSSKSAKKKKFDLEGLYFSNTFYMRYSNGLLYDRVIVDAECSLDASIRHLIQYSKMGRNFIPAELTKLTDLQKRMIQTGFNLLKAGGTLVYSTCSFCKAENENVVQWLLDNNPTAQLVPCFQESKETVPYSNGYIDNTYRFYPKNGTSGMFIAKFIKTL